MSKIVVCYALCSYCKYPLSKYILKAKNNKTRSGQLLSRNTTPCSHPFQSFQCKREAFLPGLGKIICVDRMQHFPSVVPSLLLLYKLPVKRGRLGCEIIVLGHMKDASHRTVSKSAAWLIKLLLNCLFG